MPSDEFEKALDDFLDRREYDEAETALYAMVRTAFLAGWRAAGGKALPPQKVVRLIPGREAGPAEGRVQSRKK